MSNSMNFLDAIMGGNEEAMHYAVYLYENAEKYRWHDLREDKEDFPQDREKLYLAYMDNNVYSVFRGYQIVNLIDFVLAWKCIEPFEVTE